MFRAVVPVPEGKLPASTLGVHEVLVDVEGVERVFSPHGAGVWEDDQQDDPRVLEVWATTGVNVIVSANILANLLLDRLTIYC